MAFRATRIHYRHMLRERGIANLSSNNAVDSDFPLDFLIDDSRMLPMKFDASASDHWIQVDLGSGNAVSIETLFIPPGHNLGGIQLLIKSGATSTPSTLRSTFNNAFPTTSMAYHPIATPSTDRYWRIEFNATGIWEIPELILGGPPIELDRGEDLANRPVFAHRDTFLRFDQIAGGSPTLKLAPRRRLISFAWHHLRDSDVTSMDAFLAGVEMHHPFVIDPPSFAVSSGFDVLEPPIWVKHDREPEVVYETQAAAKGTAVKSYRLNMIESLD